MKHHPSTIDMPHKPHLKRCYSCDVGTIDTKAFEKTISKLCGGERAVKSDQLGDIERYVDPDRDGVLDILFLAGRHTVVVYVAQMILR